MRRATLAMVGGLCHAVAVPALDQPAAAALLCRHQKSGRVSFRETACKKKELPVDLVTLGVVGPSGPSGSSGPPGPTGADGTRPIYGDGSAGARVVAANATLDDPNPQYTDFTVAAGVMLNVSSGAVIRCTGTFRNDGTIVVLGAALGGGRGTFGDAYELTYRPPEAGVAGAAAYSGEVGVAGDLLSPGQGGRGLTAPEARLVLRPGRLAGGGGGVSVTGAGATGGGSLTVLAATAIVNPGVIQANGADGGPGKGGGGAGVVILASAGTVTTSGTIQADGGDGAPSNTVGGGGGGGGGGIVHLLAPTINPPGVVTVAGGSAGATGAPGSVTLAPRAGGGGGGGCGGLGGTGGSVNATGDPGVASDGQPGHSLQTVADPTALF